MRGKMTWLLILLALLPVTAFGQTDSMATRSGLLCVDAINLSGEKDTSHCLVIKLVNGLSMSSFCLRNHATSARILFPQQTTPVIIESDTDLGGKLITLFDVDRFWVVDSMFCHEPTYSPDKTRIAYLSHEPKRKQGRFGRCLVLYDMRLPIRENYAEGALRPKCDTDWLEQCPAAFLFDPERRGFILYPSENVESGEYALETPCPDFPICPGFTSSPFWSPSGNLLAILHFGDGKMRLVWADLSKGSAQAAVSTRTLLPETFARKDKHGAIPVQLFAELIEFLEGEHAVRIHPQTSGGVTYRAPFVVPLVPEE